MAQRKTTQFNMRMDPELKEVAEKAAAADRGSLSSLIEKLLETPSGAGTSGGGAGQMSPSRNDEMNSGNRSNRNRTLNSTFLR
jgi:hypothetical protein